MRIIAGEFRGRRITAPAGERTRPTPERLRESLFSILGNRIEGVVFADIYAGSGAVGIEALSRGAERALFVERSHAAAIVIRQNLADLELGDRATIIERPALLVLSTLAAEIVFLAPPYPAVKEFPGALEALSQGSSRLVIIQHSAKRFSMPEQSGGLRRVRIVTQGTNALSFYEPFSEL